MGGPAPALRLPASCGELGVLFGRDAHGAGEGFEEIAVVIEAGLLTSLPHGVALGQENLGNGDALGGDVLVDGGSGVGLENPAQIGSAEIKNDVKEIE